MIMKGALFLFLLSVLCSGHDEIGAKESLQQDVEFLKYIVNERNGYDIYDDGIVTFFLERMEKTIQRLDNEEAPCEIKTYSYCPNGWMRHNESCYLFVEKTQSYSNARANCIDLEAQLAHIENANENSFIVSNLKTLQEPEHWIGLTDVANEGNYQWENGNEITFSYWSNGQPDNGGGKEDCVHFRAAYSYKWNDALCEREYGSICELYFPSLK